jgi:hypothetical protein
LRATKLGRKGSHGLVQGDCIESRREFAEGTKQPATIQATRSTVIIPAT